MTVEFHDDIDAYLAACGEFLLAHEIEHNIILSTCAAARQKGYAELRFATLRDEEGGIAVTSVIAPGRNLVLSRSQSDALEPLAQELAQQGLRFPGLVGPSDTASRFAPLWEQAAGQPVSSSMDQIIYALHRVVMPVALSGKMRAAQESDAQTLSKWLAAFTLDALPADEHVTPQAALPRVQEMVAARRIYVLEDEDGAIVAQAAYGGTPEVARVNMVYTPPAQRGRGYASTVVALLSEKLLEGGCKACCLYADARNPVSNAIYRKIGYEFVSRASMYTLEMPKAQEAE